MPSAEKTDMRHRVTYDATESPARGLIRPEDAKTVSKEGEIQPTMKSL
jgi:hypothetical protein